MFFPGKPEYFNQTKKLKEKSRQKQRRQKLSVQKKQKLAN